MNYEVTEHEQASRDPGSSHLCAPSTRVYRLVSPLGHNAALHRVEKARVLEVIEASPFVLEAESDVLANPDDDLSAMVFAPEIRGKTSRFLLRLRKAG